MSVRRAVLVGGTALSLAAGLIMPWEGLSNKAYLDIVQVPTICYGYTHNVQLGDLKTDDECYDLLVEEILYLDGFIDRHVTVDLTDYQRAAILSWMYNVGPGAFQRSTLLKKLNAGDYTGACNELTRWVHAGGKRVNGLVKRREAEKEMCLRDVESEVIQTTRYGILSRIRNFLGI